MKRFLSYLAVFILVCSLFYLSGPKPDKPVLSDKLPAIELKTGQVEQYIQNEEASLPVKPDNAGKIIWNNDSIKNQTAYCLLYLHGFSASGYEGYPTHVDFARHFHMNAFIPRLASHGLEVKDPLMDMTPDLLYNSAKENLRIAHILGKKVIIMSTSTGGTLSLKLAAEFPDLVDGLILLSPNIRINNPAAFLLDGPWGLQIARMVFGGKYRYTNNDPSAEECRYWNCFYRLEATVYLQQLIDATMKKEVFERVHTPVFLGYYYKDRENQDPVVKVDAALKMFDQLGTPAELKEKQSFNAGTHVIGCKMFSKTQPEVEKSCIRFAERIMKIEK